MFSKRILKRSLNYQDLNLPKNTFKVTKKIVLESCYYHLEDFSLEEKKVLDLLIELFLNRELSYLETISLREVQYYLRDTPDSIPYPKDFSLSKLVTFLKSQILPKRNLNDFSLIDNIIYLKNLLENYSEVFQEKILFIDLRGSRIFIHDIKEKTNLTSFLDQYLEIYSVTFLQDEKIDSSIFP